MKLRLSKRAIDDARYEGTGSCFVWDTETAGFGIRIYPTGRKSFVIVYRSRGRQRFLILGRYGVLTLQQARAKALGLFSRILNGEDPSEQRRLERQAPTVEDLADRHIDDHAKINNKPRSAKRARQLWDRSVLPKLGKRKVADIKRPEIAKLMTSMATTPAMANKTLTLLSKAFNLAEVWGWRPEGTNPCRHVQRFKEESRERYLSESELQRLGEVLSRIEHERTALTQAVAAIRLLILTGCRSSEILKLRWDEVDFEMRCLRLSDSKTGKRTVVLNTDALEILSEIERIEGKPYVIPGGKIGGHLSTLQPLWNRVRVEADIADVRVHDLRHTFASYAVNHGHGLAFVGKLLGHSKIQTTQRYAHLADDPLRRVNEQIGTGLAAGLKGERPQENASPADSGH